MPQYITQLLDFPLLIVAIFVSGIGGTFQYGYNISVMTSPSAFIKDLVNRTCVYRYNINVEQWQVSLLWSFTVSIFCVGGLVGSLIFGPMLSKLGRKKGMLLNNSWAIFGAVLMILSQPATSFEMIMVGRFLYGINAGTTLVIHPILVIDYAPKTLRGMTGVSVSTCMALGRVTGQLLGMRELLGNEKNWPWLLGFSGFTALLQLLTLPFLPESPSFLLLERGDRQECEKALTRLWGDKDHSRTVEEMLEEDAALKTVRRRSLLELVADRRVRWQFMTLIVVFTAVQLCGISAVYFYSFEVFRAAGIPELSIPYAVVGIGACEVFSSITSLLIVENVRRKVLLAGGHLSMAGILTLLTATLYLQAHISWIPYCSMVLTFVLVFLFACGPAAVTSTLPGQIFSQSFKTSAYSFAAIINWIWLFLVGICFPVLVENLGYSCFVIFLLVCACCGVFVHFNVPETKNRTILEITAEFERMHNKSGEPCSKTTTHDYSNGIKIQETTF